MDGRESGQGVQEVGPGDGIQQGQGVHAAHRSGTLAERQPGLGERIRNANGGEFCSIDPLRSKAGLECVKNGSWACTCEVDSGIAGLGAPYWLMPGCCHVILGIPNGFSEFDSMLHNLSSLSCTCADLLLIQDDCSCSDQ